MRGTNTDRLDDCNEEPRHVLRAIEKASACWDTWPDDLAAQAPSAAPKRPLKLPTEPATLRATSPRPTSGPDPDPRSALSEAPPIPTSSANTTEGFARRLWRYMYRDTLAQTAAVPCPALSAVPLYTSETLALLFHTDAQAVVSDKARRTGHALSTASMDQRTSRMLTHTLTYLTHTGRVVTWRHGVQVVCAYTIAAFLGKMLHLVPHAQGTRVPKEPAVRAETLHARLQRADSRFRYIQLAAVADALALLAQQGLVQPVQGQSYLPMVLQARQKGLAKVPSR